MQISVQAKGKNLTTEEIDRITKDLEKIERRLNGFPQEVFAKVRVSEGTRVHGFHVVLELDYGRHHVIAKDEHGDLGQAVRAARDDAIRQINDHSRGGHSSFSKGR
jgi:ribosome-associated translation inhibitor RaiA